ncbi:GtrA family protein [Altererythrobacter sp.]|uniref:GtrA family protein n=1 Tax=Altererythrobacter sp. TaxID=1872480 RepID=UPI001B131CE6|nr:GtrA family protein [Altererythrobacter sp.]MBO6609667.1 GtrA family protein [Altererythrobacter sp.]MBO6641183.1 GtrA family protein [Altererythrobacter sp.]MBO6708119.1 GtrA family protein [Altererythrobacter sp.]MBO6945747.1 GtrA family protein [Altererythrobacter sp.]
MTRPEAIDRDLAKEWIRFGIVGVTATISYTVVSLSVFEIWMSALIANLIGYLASVGISYFGHARFSFRSRQRHAVQGPRFIALSGFTYLLTNAILYAGLEVLKLGFLISTIVVACSIPVITWAIARRWVFGSTRD